MSHIKGLIVLAGAAASLTGSAFAAEPTVSRDEIRAIVSEMMADAETRSSLLQGGGSAGYDGSRFFIMGGENNAFRLNVGGFVQVRYTMNFRDDQGASGNEWSGGFQNRRTVVGFSGYAGGKDTLQYNVRLISSNGGSLSFDDAFARLGLGDGWWFRAGQYKPAFLKEELNSDVFTLTADRGVVNGLFTLGRSQGAGLTYETDNFDFAVDFHEGANRQNTSFTNGLTEVNTTTNNGNILLVPAAADYAFAARANWIFAGTRDQLKDYTSKQGEGFAGQLGAALNFQQSANNGARGNPAAAGPPVVPARFDADQLVLGYTVDASIETNGFNAFAAFVGQHTDVNAVGVTGGLDNIDDFGVVLQAGFRIVENTELFGRYDWVYVDGDRGNNQTRNHNFLTFGVNQYVMGHAAKFTVDTVFSLNRTGNDANASRFGAFLNDGFSNTTGLLGTNKGAEVAVRAQFQVMF
ncbi:MAG: hypothetical protein IOD15_10480 [Phycisphaerales bacterium]|jgi:hypothetical protein|nr:hypothetical protein [Phycisphaerales bacterium]